MKLKRCIAGVIDLLIIYSVYFTLQGLLVNLGSYAPFIASLALLPVIFYLFGANDGIGKVIMSLENKYEIELNKYQKITAYPVTSFFCMQIILNAIYPFFLFTLGYTGLLIIALLNLGILLLLVFQTILLMLGKDYWNVKNSINIIKRQA